MYTRRLPRKTRRSSFMTSTAGIGDDETTVDWLGVPIVTFPTSQPTSTTSTLMKYLPWAVVAGVAYWALLKR